MPPSLPLTPALPEVAAPGTDALLAPLAAYGVRLGLERIRGLLHALGDPHLAYPTVLVGGTNGKGSTSALLAAVAGAAGYRTGLTTSPHLEVTTERVRIDGRAVADEVLAGALERVLAAAGPDLPTYFEAVTAAAFLLFREVDVELAVVEVGLGGRLDATNVAEPVASVVTGIGLDHEAQLGSTLESIAGEKAGIFRAGRPAFATALDPAVRRVLVAAAEAAGAELVFVEDAVSVRAATPPAARPQRIALRTPRGSYDLALALAGRHQLANLALAVLAAEALADRGFPRLDAQAIAAGVAAARWPGRLEEVALPGGPRVLLDAAHNPAGAATLRAFLDAGGEPFALLFGALSDKRVDGMLPPLAAAATTTVLTVPPSDRAADPAAWADLVAGCATVVEPDPDRALDLALAASPGLLVVAGSIFLVGHVRRRLRERFGVPPPAADLAVPEPAR